MKYIILISVVLLIVVLAVVIYYFSAGIGELKHWKKEWTIMGIREGFVPQGIAYSRVYNKFLICGPVKKGEPARLYVVDAKTMMTDKFVTFKMPGGTDYTGSASGVACNNYFAFLSGEGKAYRFRLGDVINARCWEKISFDNILCTETGGDFCFVSQGLLFVGDYYKMSKRPTDITHHIISDGTSNNAIVYGFRLSGEEMPSKLPEKAISVPDMVSGMQIYGGKIFLCTSNGLQKSKIAEYENILQKSTQSSIVFGDKRVPLWIVGEKYKISSKTFPPMLDEFVIANGRMFLLFVSASKKYRKFMRTRIKNVYSKRLN